MKKIQTILLTALTLVGLASCTAEEHGGGTSNQDSNSTVLLVAPLPGYAEPSSATRANTATIGVQDPGKTTWKEGDTLAIEISFYDDKYQNIGQAWSYATYTGGVWTLGDGLTTLSHSKNLPLAIRGGKVLCPAGTNKIQGRAYYAPGQTFAAHSDLYTTNPAAVGQREQWVSAFTTTPNTAIVLNKWEQNYNRLRVAAAPGDVVKLEAPGFTPVGSYASLDAPISTSGGPLSKRPGEPVGSLTVTADAKGNAYFYGAWNGFCTFTVSLAQSTLYGNTETQVFQKKVSDTQGTHFVINALEVL